MKITGTIRNCVKNDLAWLEEAGGERHLLMFVDAERPLNGTECVVLADDTEQGVQHLVVSSWDYLDEEKVDSVSAIASQKLGIASLEPRGNDGRDFHDLHVSTIHHALNAAYEAGRKSR